MTDSEIDAALSESGVPEDSEEEIEELAHLCRVQYLAELEDSDPELYLKGATGADERVSGLIEKEAAYSDERVR